VTDQAINRNESSKEGYENRVKGRKERRREAGSRHLSGQTFNRLDNKMTDNRVNRTDAPKL
jgi:hypothetical protein